MSLLYDLTNCEHPDDRRAQAMLTNGVMQWCACCGACRLLQGQHPGPWRRPDLVEAAIRRVVAAAKDEDAS
jgi:hypothetical protein